MIRLYLITPDEGDPAPAVEAALSALPRGAAGVQLRQRLSARALLERARALRAICTRFAAPLLVNDRADVALAARADGVHLPASGMTVADARALGLTVVGESVHSPEEAARSEADLVLFAPVFETPGKTAQGLEKLAAACRATPRPIFALGGVTPDNAARCIDAGARGVACIRSVLGAADPAKAAISLWKAVVLTLLLAAGAARADDTRYQDYPVGSRAMVLGGAFVALSEDPSGLYYNPAGICDARKLNVNVSASLYGIERQTHDVVLINKGTFSLATLNELNVIPGEAGLIKGVGELDARGTPFAYGFDVTVPQFRSYTSDATTPFQVHTQTMDRTFNVSAGGAMRLTDRINIGAALQYVLRIYSSSEDALSLSGDPNEPNVRSYHANASFQNGNLVGLLGVKYRHSEEWLFGASLGLPGIPIESSGHMSLQDVVSDPTAPPGSRTHATVINITQVDSHTTVPAMMRLGAAWIKPHQWTLSAQLTGHLGTSYDRFEVDPTVAARLGLQDHIERVPVLDFNMGGEYLINADFSVAGGFFTSRSAMPEYVLNTDGTLAPGSSRQPNVSLYGGTATLGLLGQHAISRIGLSVSYGTGEDAVPTDPTGTIDPSSYRSASVKQLYFYVFLASTFRY